MGTAADEDGVGDFGALAVAQGDVDQVPVGGSRQMPMLRVDSPFSFVNDAWLAPKITVGLLDDVDCMPAAETLVFGVHVCEFKIDLSVNNAQALRKAVDHRHAW